MTVLTDNQNQVPIGQPSLSNDLDAIANSATSRQNYIETAFKVAAEKLHVLQAILEQQVDGRTVTREYAPQGVSSVQLVDLAFALSVEAQMDSTSRAKFAASEHGEILVVSCPLVSGEDKSTFGAMTWFLKFGDRNEAQKITQVVEHVTKLINTNANKISVQKVSQRQAEKNSVEQQRVKAFLNASKFENVTALCFALVNSYCQKLGCQRTAIGLVTSNQVRINAVSGIDTIVENSPAIVQIQQAQEECLDNGRRVVVQPSIKETDLPSDGLLIHKRWHQANGGASVASFPIGIEGKKQPIAIVSLERELAKPFKKEELDQIEKTVQAFGPAIELMKKSSRSLRQHAKDSLRENFLARFKNKAFAICAAAALAFVIFGWLPYRPTIPCTIQPAKINHLTAPYDAVVANAPLFAGDKIEAGQTIIQLDTTALELERDSIIAQINAQTINRNQAMAKRDKTGAAIIDAQMESERVRLESIERKIALGSMCADYEGTIIRGDLRHQIGQVIPQGTPLMEIAPVEGMRIQLEIPEEKAALIEVGFVGTFSAGSRPGDRHEFKITKITPSTTIRNGKNVLLAEAEVIGNSDWMKTGMTGYASVKTGWQPVWWMMSHRIVDSLRLGYWL